MGLIFKSEIEQVLNSFYRAMLCIAQILLSARFLSVRLSHGGIVPKRLNVSSNFFHDR